MATEAQIAANRRNAKKSTGPKTAEGKARSALNGVTFGLFSTTNCVQAEEQEEYEALSKGLWEDLNPVGIVEQMFATEIVRGAWRLRRCAEMEGTLGILADRLSRKRFAAARPGDTYKVTRDPLFYDFSKADQIAADRARAQATSSVRRATTELRRLQTERLLRSAFLPADAGSASFGLASLSEVLPFLDAAQRKEMRETPAPVAQTDPPAQPESAASTPETENTKRTRSGAACSTEETFGQTARSAPCPCGKDLKYKRCCGRSAPGVIFAKAA